MEFVRARPSEFNVSHRDKQACPKLTSSDVLQRDAHRMNKLCSVDFAPLLDA